jgi:hypothetical protein
MIDVAAAYDRRLLEKDDAEVEKRFTVCRRNLRPYLQHLRRELAALARSSRNRGFGRKGFAGAVVG